LSCFKEEQSMAEQIAEHCMACEAPLQYNETGQAVSCWDCGHNETSTIICPNGHYICNTCHSDKPLKKLSARARSTNSDVPEDILEEFLALPGLPMHGPEHHAMPGLALLLACDHLGIKLTDGYIEETIRRCMQIPGGTCGYHGACGGAISLGVAVSIFTGATPVKGKARGIAHRATAMALLQCGDEEARCCKRASRMTVCAGREFFAAELGIVFPQTQGEKICSDVARNKECAKMSCRYYQRLQKPVKK
jgi:hypothetical protein